MNARRHSALGARVGRRAQGATVLSLFGVALFATACGSSTQASHAASTTSTSVLSLRPTTPETEGSVAAITGSSMEVQDPETGQVTVDWTAATTFTQTLAVAASALVVGDCVSVTGTQASSSAADRTVAASSVTLTQPNTSGGCSTGTGAISGFGAGTRTGNRGSSTSTSHPNTPTGAFAFATGKVTTESSAGFTVEGVLRHESGTRPTSTTSTSSRPRTTTTLPTALIEVTTTSSTTYLQISSTNPSGLTVGKCVTARGPASQTGAITATAISIQSPGANGCGAGIGGFGLRGTTSTTTSGSGG